MRLAQGAYRPTVIPLFGDFRQFAFEFGCVQTADAGCDGFRLVHSAP
jgi:hypothetical protein